MLFWVLEAISLITAFFTASSASATLIGFISFFFILFFVLSLISFIIVLALSLSIPAKTKRIKSIETYEVEKVDTAYVYLTDGEKIPIEYISKVRPTKKETFLECVNYAEGGAKGFWLWNNTIYVPEFFLYEKRKG